MDTTSSTSPGPDTCTRSAQHVSRVSGICCVQDGSLILPGEAGRRNLGPLYSRLHSAIRRQDEDTLLFWEPPTWAHWASTSNINILNKMLVNFFK